MAPRLAKAGILVGGVRLDSGDLAPLAKAARRLLDDAGLGDTIVFASGNLDEHRIAELRASGAPIDGFGVGTALATSSDAPALDMVYKLQSYAGVARRKRSPGKATWPGIKQVSRRFDDAGHMAGDTVHLADEDTPGTALLQPCMRRGRRLERLPTLDQSRAHHARECQRLPFALMGLDDAHEAYAVEFSRGLHDLIAQVDAATR
jgi:nicotinate phosphoribosyltransferase